MQIHLDTQTIECRCAGECNRLIKNGEKVVKSAHRKQKAVTYHPECFIQKAEEAIDRIYHGY